MNKGCGIWTSFISFCVWISLRNSCIYWASNITVKSLIFSAALLSFYGLFPSRLIVCINEPVFNHFRLPTGLQREHMQQPAEVLPQLLLSSALSGQPEAQRGLWLIPKGTSGNSVEAARLFVFVSRGQDVVFFENAAKHRVECHQWERNDSHLSLAKPSTSAQSFVRPICDYISSLRLICRLCPQWCERKEQCRRLQLRDLLVAPLQRLTRYSLLLRNVAKRCQEEEERRGMQVIAEQVDTSICEQLLILTFSKFVFCLQEFYGVKSRSAKREWMNTRVQTWEK